MSRVDQYDIHVSVDGTPIVDSFDKLTGGEKDSEETKYNPGGMAAPVSLGGKVMVGNVTVSRLYRLNRDHGLMPFLDSKVGKGGVTIVKQPLDINGAPFGKPIVYSGTLKTLTFPEPDSESSDAALFTMEISSATVVPTS